MKKIPFATFQPMHDEIKDELEAAYRRVIEKGIFIQGEECSAFEQEYAAYCGTKYCVGMATGLDSLTLLLKAMDIDNGDEVIIPANTFIATALAVSACGATPVLVEPDIKTYNLDASRIEAAITERTKIIIAVHLYGRTADMDAINAVADEFGLAVIEDAAQAHGARYKGARAGALAQAAAFSFYPGKNLGALGDGGCITTDDAEIAAKVRDLGNYGSDYKYHHITKGTNSRLDELQAAFLRIKLKSLDRWNEYRRQCAARYIDGITAPSVSLPCASTAEYEHIYHIFAIRSKRRDELAAYLEAHGIMTGRHYPIPIHKQGAYREMSRRSLPIAEEISRTQMSLPMYYGLTADEQEYIIEKINDFGYQP